MGPCSTLMCVQISWYKIPVLYWASQAIRISVFQSETTGYIVDAKNGTTFEWCRMGLALKHDQALSKICTSFLPSSLVGIPMQCTL
eukprot:3934556-Rhodomonas_salina.1